MKLLDIVPILFETATEDDPFAEIGRRPVGRELINILERKECAISYEIHRIKQSLIDQLQRTPGCHYLWNYPGGSSQAYKDIEAGKLIKIKIDNNWGKTRRGSRESNSYYVVPNTPEGLDVVHRIDEKKHRVYQLMKREDQIHIKLVRDRRTVSEREANILRKQKRAEANARFGNS